MEKRHLGLISGTIITGIAVLLVGYMGVVIATEFPNTEVLIANEELSPGTSTGGIVEINHRDDFFIGVRTTPATGPMILNIIGEDGGEILGGAFDDLLFERLSGVKPGFYQLTLQNLSPNTAKITVVMTEKNIPESFEDLIGVTLLGFAGLLLIIPGIALMIVFGVYTIFVKIKGKKTDNIVIP